VFERNKIDNVAELTAIPVEITLADGTTEKGKVLGGAGKALGDILNGPGGFVEFEPYGGERRFLAKTQLAAVRPVGVPRAPNLKARVRDVADFDPHAILGVAPGAGREELRKAYFALAKVYHPDRYATAELPPEVIEYLFAMARRVNAAHAALEAPQKVAAVRQQPVYTSAPR
jgi:hypothetical protein